MGYLFTSPPANSQARWAPSPNALPSSWNSNVNLNSNLGPVLQAGSQGAGGINVVQSFPWTLTPTSSRSRQNAPFIILKEYYQLETQLNQMYKPYEKQSLANLGTAILSPGSTIASVGQGIVSGNGLAALSDAVVAALSLFTIDENTNALYKGLFDHLNESGFTYILPYFNDEYFKTNNKWEGVDILDKIIDLQVSTGSFVLKSFAGVANFFTDKDISVIQKLSTLPRTLKNIEIFNLQGQNPAVGLFDPPKVWKGSDPRSYTFKFALFNIDSTGAKNSEELIVKNWEFCYLLTYQNLFNKRNFYTAIPPVFYEVTIPGVHYSKASYISNLNIENFGNIRRLKLPVSGVNRIDINVPDAYIVNITITDLLTPSKNQLAAVNSTSARSIVKNR